MAGTQPDAAAFIAVTYDQLAQLGASDLCCSPIELYSPDELASLPEEILRLSSGCGHPVEDAAIAPGIIVLDIGSGAGADAILAARATGPTGAVIGVDPSVAMRDRATASAADLGITWAEFRDGTAERLPVDDASVDLVISNCVLSLSTDPNVAWTEIARTLRPGGRIVVSDIVGGAATETLKAKTRCETGIEWPDYRAMLLRLGFTGIRLVRIRAARYRDGSTAASVTITARHGLEQPPVAVDLIVDDTPAAADLATTITADLTRSHGDRADIRILHTTKPADTDLIRLLLGDEPRLAGLVAAADGAPLAACADEIPARLRDLLR
jgi:SAM-dependent methyltransferase